MPEVEILNAGLSATSPTIYFRRIKWLLDAGYEFDHLFVLIDISDIQDETLFDIRDDKVVFLKPPPPVPLPAERDQGSRWRDSLPDVRQYLRQNFVLLGLATELLGIRQPLIFNLCRGAWTYNRGDPFTERHYSTGDPGSPWARCSRQAPRAAPTRGNIDTQVEKAMRMLTALHKLVSDRGIPLSLGVHPWPAQIYHNDLDSLQVRVWEAWCKDRCAHFVDFFRSFPNIEGQMTRPGMTGSI